MARETLTEIVTAEIRAELARQRKTFAQLAIMLGVNPATITRRMAGHYPWTTEELEKTARWLGIPVADLVSPRVSSRVA